MSETITLGRALNEDVSRSGAATLATRCGLVRALQERYDVFLDEAEELQAQHLREGGSLIVNVDASTSIEEASEALLKKAETVILHKWAKKQGLSSAISTARRGDPNFKKLVLAWARDLGGKLGSRKPPHNEKEPTSRTLGPIEALAKDANIGREAVAALKKAWTAAKAAQE